MGRLDGKVAIITGAARGQGRSHAVTLAREGADIVVCDICAPLQYPHYPAATEEELYETVRLVEDLDRRCIAVKADVRDLRQMEAVAERAMREFGHIDILLANAGIHSIARNSWEMPEDQWQEMIDVNLTGVWKTCRAVIPHMIRSGRGGAIVITSSINGLKGSPSWSHYVAAKHGVVGLMRSLAIEFAPHNIRVNTIHPTGVNTPMASGAPEVLQQVDGWWPNYVSSHLSNLLDVPWVEPTDISNAILWLVSDEARYVTGTTLVVDAGLMVK